MFKQVLLRLLSIRNDIVNTTYLEVYNNGQYISPQYHNKIFEKFTQLKDGNLAKPEGSGLGLYITRKFVEQAGGKVSFISSEKEGTTFILQFP
jgi:signal transduction histidine kinase